MRAFKMSEISAVDRPAQIHARSTILKRDDGEPYWKRDFTQDQRDQAASTGAALPDGSFPIKNGGDLENAIHDVGRAKDPAKAKAHIIARAKTLGLTSKLPDGWVTKGRIEMTEDEVKKMLDAAVAKTTEPLKAEIATLKAGKKKQSATGDDPMEPDDGDDDTKKAWRAYVGKMVEKAVAAATETLKAEYAKQAEIAKGDETFEAEGVTIRKSEVGEASFKVMKAQQDKLELADFEKRATSDIPNLPGETTLKAKVLRAVSKMEKDVREGLEAMLKGGSAAFKTLSKSAGADTPPDATTDQGKLDAMVNDYATKNSVTKAVAYTKVLETPEGAELYNKTQVAKRNSH